MTSRRILFIHKFCKTTSSVSNMLEKHHLRQTEKIGFHRQFMQGVINFWCWIQAWCLSADIFSDPDWQMVGAILSIFISATLNHEADLGQYLWAVGCNSHCILFIISNTTELPPNPYQHWKGNYCNNKLLLKLNGNRKTREFSKGLGLNEFS